MSDISEENLFERFPLLREQIVIKNSGGYTPEGQYECVHCTGCGREAIPDPVGPNLSMEGLLFRPVCDACGQKYAPNLLALVLLSRVGWEYYNYDPETETPQTVLGKLGVAAMTNNDAWIKDFADSQGLNGEYDEGDPFR